MGHGKFPGFWGDMEQKMSLNLRGKKTSPLVRGEDSWRNHILGDDPTEAALPGILWHPSPAVIGVKPRGNHGFVLMGIIPSPPGWVLRLECFELAGFGTHRL